MWISISQTSQVYLRQDFIKINKFKTLEIEIPIQFYGTAEIIGFTQYLTGVMLKQLPNDLMISSKHYFCKWSRGAD